MNCLKTYSVADDISAGAVNLKKLSGEISASAYVTGFASVSKEGDALKVFGGSLANESSLDSLVSTHVAESLEEHKDKRYDEIDAKTAELIAAGSVYDDGSNGPIRFSNSIPAQSNWTNISARKELFNALGMFPISISTYDNDEYDLSYANVDAFYGAVVGTIKAHYDSGRALKKSIYDAADRAAVDAVVDGR